jgi:hypothetical protein
VTGIFYVGRGEFVQLYWHRKSAADARRLERLDVVSDKHNFITYFCIFHDLFWMLGTLHNIKALNNLVGKSVFLSVLMPIHYFSRHWLAMVSGEEVWCVGEILSCGCNLLAAKARIILKPSFFYVLGLDFQPSG